MISKPQDKAERDARLRAVLEAIEQNPEHWDQSMWHCGTSHCFAGFAQLMARGLPLFLEMGKHLTSCGLVAGGRTYFALDEAMQWLGFTELDQWYDEEDTSPILFRSTNTLADLRRLVAEITATPYGETL